MYEVIQNLKNHDRYKDFIFFDKEVKFSDFFKDKTIEMIKVHDVTPIFDNADIIGYAGEFHWENNEITPLDGDSYNQDMHIWGYHELDPNGYIEILTEDW